MNLLVSVIDDLLENRLCDIQKLLDQRIKGKTIKESAYEIGIKFSNDIFKRNKSLPNQPIDKKVMYDIKILNQDCPLWLSVDKEDNSTPSDMPISFLISYITFPNQLAYQIFSGSLDLNTEEELYYALDKSTPLSRFKKQPTNEGALRYCFSMDDSISSSTYKRMNGKT
ncbi:hypothetical protein F8M41_007770 [Gigaspora margarita]|uniref:Uncharacterized protein n=1 Tax=Gigaspora margarita TaxID=4874 RepID=A0A8H3X4J3_GIGMA|nr:hypothetical protein F8M41_007770 [Gigaspora margarita]